MLAPSPRRGPRFRRDGLAQTAHLCYYGSAGDRPIVLLRIDSADDVETALILLAVGLLVGEVAARGRRARRDHEVAAKAVLRVHLEVDRTISIAAAPSTRGAIA